MATDSEVRAFLNMSIFKKAKLQQDDPAKYKELKEKAAKDYSPESDPEAAKSVEKKDD